MSEITPPKENKKDSVLSALKVAIELAPGGSLATYLLNLIVKPPVQKRIEQWMTDVTNAVNKHTQDLDSLRDNQRFITTFIQASQIATRNHNCEKLSALQNAVLNSINPPSYSESLQIHFLHLVDRFTEWHLRILKIFSDDNWLPNSNLGSFGHGRSATENVIKHHYPDFSNKELFIDLILEDLQATRLIHTEWNGPGPMAIQRVASVPSITSMGREFLTFIEEPNVKHV
jgi:hypothetical protein